MKWGKVVAGRRTDRRGSGGGAPGKIFGATSFFRRGTPFLCRLYVRGPC